VPDLSSRTRKKPGGMMDFGWSTIEKYMEIL